MTSCPVQAAVVYPSKDAWIVERSPTTNYGASGRLYVGTYTDTDQNHRSLLEFDLSPISEPVVGATLYMYRQYKYGYQSLSVDLHRITRSWTENGATWNSYDGTNPWASAGGGLQSSLGCDSAA